MLASLIFSGSNWLWPALILAGLVCLVLVWGYFRQRAGFAGWVAPMLKVLGVAALAVCLLEPLWTGQRARPGSNLFALVADNSEGMRIKDRGETRSRGDLLRDFLNSEHASWLETMEQSFEVRRYLFDGRLQGVKDFGELNFDGKASAIGASLRTIGERYHGRPLAGVLLFTDGNATDIRDNIDLTGLPPVYPVVVGSTQPIKDIALRQTRVSQSSFEDAPVSIQGDVAATDYGGEAVTAQLIDALGKKVMEQTLRSHKQEDVLSFRFQVKPDKPGVSFYRFRARARQEIGSEDVPETTQEATLANNSTVLAVDRGRGPYRILYISGRPNWEFKFLNRAVSEDDQLQLVGLIRVAKREPKFNFLGRAGESSNPLFRGFGNQAPDEVERYDQPVLVSLNTRDELELRGGFPRTPEELYAYDAVIVDDLEAEFFTPDQATLVQKFVSERGGGFLMLGGMECFQQGKYQRTPIGDMLPVYLDKVEDAVATGPLHLNLTQEGWLQSWARLRDNENDEKARLQSMAPFLVLNKIRGWKPGASVIATVAGESGGSYPALVVQRFGRGQTAALTIGDIWHWGLHDADSHRDMDKAWRQLVRWLVSDVPNRVDLTVAPGADLNGTVTLQVRARDQKFQPMDDANVGIEVEPVMVDAGSPTNVIRLQADASLTEPGLFEAKYVPRGSGGYRATATVTNDVGAEVGRAQTGWSTDLAGEEFKSLTPNVALLKMIAQKTGGEVIEESRLGEFARSLPQRHAPVMDSWTYPVWHTPAMFAFALACFIGEWGLRRWKGLP